MTRLNHVFLLFTFLSTGLSARSRNLADVPCGQQWRRSGRIVGGQAAEQGEFPWLVSIKRHGGHFCGGTIVNKRWVITAGHCMCSGPTQLSERHMTVTVGEHDLTARDSAARAERKVLRVHLHPQYQCSRYVHDIALLELESDIPWSGAVGPACLPITRDTSGYSSFTHREATTAGWGWTHENYSKGTRGDVLQKVKLIVIDNAQCREWYLSQGKKVKIQDSQMCAGHEQGGRDACWADSGGPLMVADSEATMVVGVVSTGIGCGRPRLPGLYTRMSDYMPWILSTVQG